MSSETSDRPLSPGAEVSVLRQAWETGWRAAHQNWRAGLVLWLFGATIVAAYAYWPAATKFFDRWGELKTQGGLWFSAISTALFGGLVPTWIAALTKGTPSTNGAPRHSLSFLLLTNGLLWAAKGCEIDLWYRFQAWLWGSATGWYGLLGKTFLDQAIYVPIFGLINVLLFVRWRDAGFSIARMLTELGPQWYRREVVPVLISNWLVWIPAVMLIYVLPLPLQLPIQNLVLVFWILVLTVFTSQPPVEKQTN